MSFVKQSIENGGQIKPLIINDPRTGRTGLCNSSILVLNDQIFLNLRNVEYVLYHSELGNAEHPWGPLLYFHPENDKTLRTKNFICELDNNLNITHHELIDTSKLDVSPKWEFIGLEDGRLVYWNNKFYLCGVRRDTTRNGVGRMELSEIDIKNGCKEVRRYRIEPPVDKNSYCEKNWMPIVGLPFHFVKWTNPTEIVKINLEDNTSEQVILTEHNPNMPDGMRGGSTVISYKDGYISFVHQAELWYNELNRKDSRYTHRIVYWDNDWNLQKVSNAFTMMNGKIEFVCGLTQYKENYLVTFGFQDNSAFILKTNEKTIEEFLNV